MSTRVVVNPAAILNDGSSALVNAIVGTGHLITGIVHNTDLLDGSISGSAICDGALLSSHYSNNSVQQTHILSGSTDLFTNQVVSGSKNFANSIRLSGPSTSGVPVGRTVSLGANCPAVASGVPYTWITFYAYDGTPVFMPAWK